MKAMRLLCSMTILVSQDTVSMYYDTGIPPIEYASLTQEVSFYSIKHHASSVECINDPVEIVSWMMNTVNYVQIGAIKVLNYGFQRLERMGMVIDSKELFLSQIADIKRDFLSPEYTKEAIGVYLQQFRCNSTYH